jgi:hypothetical protein
MGGLLDGAWFYFVEKFRKIGARLHPYFNQVLANFVFKAN